MRLPESKTLADIANGPDQLRALAALVASNPDEPQVLLYLRELADATVTADMTSEQSRTLVIQRTVAQQFLATLERRP
jgi:hypothetical protein